MSGLPGHCSFTDTLLCDISWASSFFPNRNLLHWGPAMLLLTIPLVALGIGMVVVLKERIKEIKSGEEDDLDKY